MYDVIRDRISDLPRLVKLYPGRVLVGAVVAALVVASFVVANPFREKTMVVTAQFESTSGLYVGNRVAVLGVAKGTITAVDAHHTFVEVTLEVPRDLPIPADAHAIIASPNPVSDRTIELYPVYQSGPRLAEGATIPLSRTAAPLPVDTILNNLDQLARTLGPDGANKQGALSSVVDGVARLADGSGSDIRATLRGVAEVLPSLVGDPGQIRRLLSSLSRLTSALATHDATLDRVLSSVTTATTQIAAERGTISAAITNLGTALTEVTAFVETNRGTMKSSLVNLKRVTTALVADQDALVKTFRVSPLGFQNFGRIVDLDAPCFGKPGRCPMAFARVILAPGASRFTNTYCEDLINTLIPILASGLPGIGKIYQPLNGVKPATTRESLCVAQHAVYDGHDQDTPGAVPAPDLNLGRYLR